MGEPRHPRRGERYGHAGGRLTPLSATTDETLNAAVEALDRGELVVLPTETVYGLAARADDPVAVARLFAVKGRPAANPLIAHVGDAQTARTLVHATPTFDTAATLWPGPLTLVAERRADAPVCAPAAAGLNTLGVRVPDHGFTRAVIARLGAPLAMPSANRSGRLSATHAADAAREFASDVALVVDGGPCAKGVESTVVDVRGRIARLLRPGATPREALEAALGQLAAPEESAQPLSPGAAFAHYVPARARLRLDAEAAHPGEAYLGFGPGPHATLSLSPSGNVDEAAARLFAALRALDAAGYARVAVAAIPRTGVGAAINDRLQRAAAGHIDKRNNPSEREP